LEGMGAPRPGHSEVAAVFMVTGILERPVDGAEDLVDRKHFKGGPTTPHAESGYGVAPLPPHPHVLLSRGERSHGAGRGGGEGVSLSGAARSQPPLPLPRGLL